MSYLRILMENKKLEIFYHNKLNYILENKYKEYVICTIKQELQK